MSTIILTEEHGIQAIEEDGRIAIRAKQLTNNNSITIELEDTGKGIEPDTLDKVFESLYTAKTTGTVLGLSICKQVIDYHQGQLNLRAGKNRG